MAAGRGCVVGFAACQLEFFASAGYAADSDREKTNDDAEQRDLTGALPGNGFELSAEQRRHECSKRRGEA